VQGQRGSHSTLSDTRAYQLDCTLRVDELTHLPLRVDHLSVNGKIENAAVTIDQIDDQTDVLPQLPLDYFRQTGGALVVVSGGAVCDGDRHTWLPETRA
jgi:hypothetical protein